MSVQVEHTGDGHVLMTSSKLGSGALKFTRDEWEAFLGGAKNGEFDLDEATGSVLATYTRVTGFTPDGDGGFTSGTGRHRRVTYAEPTSADDEAAAVLGGGEWADDGA